MTQRAKNKLHIIQNKIIRFILHLQPRTHLKIERITDLNMLRVQERVKQLRLKTTHKTYYNQAPQYLQANFKKIETHNSKQETDSGSS